MNRIRVTLEVDESPNKHWLVSNDHVAIITDAPEVVKVEIVKRRLQVGDVVGGDDLWDNDDVPLGATVEWVGEDGSKCVYVKTAKGWIGSYYGTPAHSFSRLPNWHVRYVPEAA